MPPFPAAVGVKTARSNSRLIQGSLPGPDRPRCVSSVVVGSGLGRVSAEQQETVERLCVI